MLDSDRLYCRIRKEWIAATPEEFVRQRVLHHMIEDRGFPAELVAVEKSLRQMPHLGSVDRKTIPDRRADIVCFAKNSVMMGGELYPILTVECKAVKLNSGVISQVVGYNYVVRACFVAIVNQEEIRTGWYDSTRGEYVFINHLPQFHELVQFIKNKGVV